MERNLWRQVRNRSIVAAVIGAALIAVPGGSAQGDPDRGEYPESRFGSPPARISLGIDSGVASREAGEWSGAGEETSRSRAPASVLAVSQDQPQTRAEIEELKTRPLTGDENPRIPDALSISKLRNGVQEIALIASDLGYFPKTIFVNRDVPVRLFVTGASKEALCLMMDSFQVRKQVKSNSIQEVTFTPNQPGRYRFYCPVNAELQGTLIVRELN